jgi:RHS repeat-associated protein
MKTNVLRMLISLPILFLPLILNGAEVDLNGFLSHSVEIKLPPGTNGLAPNLSLDYNSGAGNGIVGHGWNLNGLPAITRDTTNGIRYDGTDSYVGSSGLLKVQSDGSYHYEYENYSKVQKSGTAGDGPAYWVETKADGTKYYYGNYGEINTASVTAIGKNGSIRAWALSRVEDVHGNYYTVDYIKDAGEYYPKRIIYTQGNGIKKFRVIDFEYDDSETRKDFWTQYVYSSAVTIKRRLVKIKVQIDVPEFFGYLVPIFGTDVREYSFEYEGGKSGVDVSRVIKIITLNGNGEESEKINFIYIKNSNGDGTWVIRNNGTLWINDANTTVISGDYNGDGKADVLLKNPVFTTTPVFLSNGDGTWSVSNNESLWINDANTTVISGDYNGDGKTDVLLKNSVFTTTPVFLSNGDGTWVVRNNGTLWINDANTTVISGDYNGDGKTDVLLKNPVFTTTPVFLSKGDGTWSVSNNESLWINDANTTVISGDYNGDGKTDVLLKNPVFTTTPVFLSNGDGTWSVSNNESLWINNVNTTVVSGDYNGDGKTDVLLKNPVFTTTPVFLSKGDGKWSVSNNESLWINNANTTVISGDYNGDGKTDVLLKNSVFTTTPVFLSKGDGTWSVSNNESLWINDANTTVISGDYNGDGKTDVLLKNSVFTSTPVFLSKSGSSGLLSKITTGIGLSIDISYKQATKLQSAIIPTDSNYPLIANSSPRELVTSITTSDSRAVPFGASYTKTYDYYNGKFRTGIPEKRQNLYFEKIIETDTSTGIKTTTYYDQRPWYAGSPVSVVTTAGNRTLKINDFTYDTTTGTRFANTHAVRLMNTLSTSYESGVPAVTNSKTLSYDAHGNTTKIIDTAGLINTAGSSSITTLITYDTDPVILNRPLEVTKTSGGKIIDSKKYTYSDNKIASMSAYLDTSGGYVETVYGTDVCGNITSIKDPAGHTTSIEYDSDYSTFIAQVTNPLGQTVSMEYDAATGNPISKTDQNGNTTESEYDGAGRLVSVTNADGDIVQEIDYHDELRGDANSQYIETIIYNDTAVGYSWSRSYYDGLGREYKKVSSAGTIDSTPVRQVVDTSYDTAGRVSSRTLPYIENKQDILKIHYSYDDAGKVIEEKRPDNVTISTSYAAVSGGIQVTKSDPKGNVSTALFDARGRLIKKTEPEGAQVSYSYDEAGRLVRTVDAGNHVTLITYDSLGRKTSITDPNTGEITYSYDLTGNLVSKTDALGNAVSYTYDEINRLTKTDYPDDTPDVVYNYDESSSANGKGRVTSVENGVSSTKYAYDSNGNVNYLRQTVENIDFIFTMEHDTQNRMTALTYPDGTRTERDYHETGYLKAVRQGTGAYVQYALKLDGNGAFKNSVRRVTGNGVDTSISYNPANMRPMAVESRDKNNTLLEQNEYTYDTNGNITKINDKFDTAKSQTFEYDRLNRLTKGKGVYGEQNFSYDPAGNLLKNSHGDLTYGDSLHPYAVTADGEGNSYTYDANGQMLTGRNREMEYDAAGRLVSLKKAGTVIQKNKYDHTGHRVLQEKKDGTLIFNINGLYEIVKTANRPDYHTKYIYGMEGDLAAQVTTSETALVAANFGNGFIFDKGYGSNPLTSLIAKGYIKADKFVSKGNNILKLQYAMVIMLLAAIAAALLKSGITRRVKQLKRSTQPIWSSAVSLVLVISIIVSFSLTGCDDIIAGITPTLGGGGSSSVTTDTEGLPTLGTYYFHPDHVGSVSYLTDSEGAVVTRMSYTPYGEKVKSASTGPNIFHHKYTGQVDDGDEAELMYYNARYYDSKIGRFISADSIIPGAGFSQSFNRYMYVAGNPVNRNDPSGHFSMGGVISAVTGAVAGGVTGASAVYGAYKAYQNRDILKSSFKNAWNSTKNFVSAHKQGFLTGAGALLGGPVMGGIGAIYGYAAGSDGGMQQFWHDNKWFRITTYVLVTVAVIAACILAPQIAVAVNFELGKGAAAGLLYGSIAGAGIGSLYGGTNGFSGGWDLENSAKYMMKGSIYGAAIGYSAGSFYDCAMSAEAILEHKPTAKILGGGIPGSIVNVIASISGTYGSSVLFYGAIPTYFLSGLSIISFPQNTEQLINHHNFTFIPGFSYDFDDNKAEVF